MPLDATLCQLRAAADASRLRLLALVADGEATVSELTGVLEQSQPRVSRHLKILSDAGLVSRFRDGHSIYYRLSPAVAGRAWVRQAIESAGEGEALIRADRQAMVRLKRLREGDAIAANRHGMSHWSEVARGRPAAEALREQLDEVLGTGDLGDLLDIGAGSGTLLRLLAGRARSAVGVDTSREMRLLARSRLHLAGLANCTIRDGDVQRLPFADQSFDVVVLDEVLGRCGDPRQAVAEAQRVLRYTGCLLVLDRILPVAQRLSSVTSSVAAGGHHLFENQLRILLQEKGIRVGKCIRFAGKSPDYALVIGRPRSEPGRENSGQDHAARQQAAGRKSA